jgi:putative Ca2+/H+ antiporter (TMEM165/GDT1 family)
VNCNWVNSIFGNVLSLRFQVKTSTLIGLFLFYVFTIWMNKRAVKKGVNPILGNIKAMQAQ